MSNGTPLPAIASVELEALHRCAALAVVCALTDAAARVTLDHDVPERLREAGASFVTLRQHGRLRGCMGTLRPRRSLVEDVCSNARAAALEDPRFEPLVRHEIAHTTIEVAVLSAVSPLAFADEADLLRQLRPGIDGVLLSYGTQHATYLPGVWQQLPDPRLFVAELRRKAGISPHLAATALRVKRYTVVHSSAARIDTSATDTP